MADSPYEGSYPIAGDLWFSDDGALIVVAGGWLFHASADPTVDMTYAGALSHAVGSPGVTGAATSTAADRIWILSGPFDQGLVVQAYEMSTTDYVASVALPAWPTPVATGGPGFRLDPVRGEFVFARPDGAGLRLLVQRVIDGRWGLLSLDAEDLP